MSRSSFYYSQLLKAVTLIELFVGNNQPHLTSAQLSETLACFPNSGCQKKTMPNAVMRTPHMAPMPRGKRREDGPLPRRHVPIALEI